MVREMEVSLEGQRLGKVRPLAAAFFTVSILSAVAGSLLPPDLSVDRYMKHVSFLASDELKGRGNGSPELERAADYISSQFDAYGLSPAGDDGSYFQEFGITAGTVVGDVHPTRKTLRNVVAAVTGSHSELRKEWIVIGAHYDHLGLGDWMLSEPSDIGKIHYGADDNASGTSGMLELARLIEGNKHRFKRSVLFVAFAAEELGMIGSSAFVDSPPVSSRSVAAMVNLDMIGRLGEYPLQILESDSSAEFETWIREANQEIGLALAFSNGRGESSDHIPFIDRQIPAFTFFTGMHKDYHSPSDTSDKIDSKGSIQILSLVAAVAERMAAATTTRLD